MKTIEDIECLFPCTLAEALAIQADERTRGKPIAGGTDLMVQWASGVLPISERCVSLAAVAELKGILEAENEVVIGAAVTHAELRRSSLIQHHFPSVAAAAALVGGLQIQARGTIAGNVANASPAGDLAPSLLISGGVAVVVSASGKRTVPLDRFYHGYRKVALMPDELIARFILPKPKPGHREVFRKLGTRAAQAISKVVGSCRGRVEDGVIKCCRVALGSVAPVPVRLMEFESWIAGRKVDPTMLDEAEKVVSSLIKPIDDIRSTAEYRKWVSGRLVRSMLEEMVVN